MAFIKVGAVSMVPPDSVVEAFAGENLYAICNVGGELHVLEGICPHGRPAFHQPRLIVTTSLTMTGANRQGEPLGQGLLSNNILMCPWHCYEFDALTGENLDNPLMRVAKVPVKVEGDDILIEVA